MAKDKILIIEDDSCHSGPSLVDLLNHDYDVTWANGVEGALSQLVRQRCDLVLAEISLPELDGLRLLRSVQQVYAELPVVFITGLGTLPWALLCLKLGAQAFVLRPFTTDELIKVVEGALQKRRRVREQGEAWVTEVLESARNEVIQALVQAMQAKDHYTRDHCERMVTYALVIADKLGLSAADKKTLGYAAALHDIGKIGIPEFILNKPDRLSEGEYEIMKTHAQRGEEIVRKISFLAPVAPLIYHHHQRYDGMGYPTRLMGEEIPLGSRVVAVLDAFDAMTSDRPYRRALPLERAVAELRLYANQQFDPVVVETFVQALEERSWDLHQFVHSNVLDHFSDRLA